MIFHASIATRRPETVARAVAELWGGEALPFPPCDGAWIAFAGDDRGSGLECLPRDTVMRPGEAGEGASFTANQALTDHAPFHLAVATPLSEAEVHALARREGWRSERCSRGGMFDVIEVWLENALLIEVLTADMQAQYRSTATIEGWKAMLAAGAPEPLAIAA
jgi:hypothetical protein